MKGKLALVGLIVLAAIAVSGCTVPYDGSPPIVDQSRIGAVKASAAAWLSGSQGSDVFKGGLLGEPMGVFLVSASVNDTSRTFDHWILPVKNSAGMYVGFLLSKTDNFTVPGSATNYPDPRHNLFSSSAEESYSAMLASSSYTADQVKEPYISVIEGKGYEWTSEVVVNGKHVARLVYPVSIIDPSKADSKV
jgi:hypothetical protein